MIALLKLIPLKDYAWAALVLVLLGAFGAYTVHERHVGEAKIEKKDAALRAAATALNTASENLADIKELNIGKVYEKYITLPAIPDAPGLVCVNTAPATEQPQTAGNRSGSSSEDAKLPDGGFNPSGELLTLLSNDDAQIAGLIDTVLNLESELQGKTK